MPDRVVVGRVVKPHGIRGEVVVAPLSDVPGRYDPGTSLFAGADELVIAAARPHQGRLLVAFEGVGDRNDAELLRGAELTAPPVDLSTSETYYAHELVGLRVLDESGRELGTVTGLVELPPAAGYDLLEIDGPEGAWQLPAVDEYVEVSDDGEGPCLRLVDPPEGLVDDARRAVVPPEGETP